MEVFSFYLQLSSELLIGLHLTDGQILSHPGWNGGSLVQGLGSYASEKRERERERKKWNNCHVPSMNIMNDGKLGVFLSTCEHSWEGIALLAGTQTKQDSASETFSYGSSLLFPRFEVLELVTWLRVAPSRQVCNCKDITSLEWLGRAS